MKSAAPNHRSNAAATGQLARSRPETPKSVHSGRQSTDGPKTARALQRVRPASWLTLIALWTVLPLLVTIAADLVSDPPVSLPRPPGLPFVVLIWWPWVPLTPLVAGLGRSFPIRSPHPLRHTMLHVLVSWLLALLLNLYFAGVATLLPQLRWPPALIWNIFEGLGALTQLLYWSVLAAAASLVSWQRSRQRRALLAEARLASLTAQIRPHFLFNTLNTISTLIDEDVPAARRMISHLSELLRASLRSHGAQEVTLAEELELVRSYLEIEAVRFEDRLRLEFEIQDEARQALVPHLLLQPLVENAIRHGISRDFSAGELKLEAEVQGSSLWLRVHDDGPGPGPEAPATAEPRPRGGIGLGNLRARLEELYGAAGRLELRHRQPRGTTVEVALPLHYRATGAMP